MCLFYWAYYPVSVTKKNSKEKKRGGNKLKDYKAKAEDLD